MLTSDNLPGNPDRERPGVELRGKGKAVQAIDNAGEARTPRLYALVRLDGGRGLQERTVKVGIRSERKKPIRGVAIGESWDKFPIDHFDRVRSVRRRR